MMLEEWGLHAQLLVAGFAGGVAHAFAFKQTKPVAQVGSIVVGAFTANYVGPVVAQIPHIGPPLGDGFWAFAVGISAMAIVQGLAAAVQVKISKYLGAEDENQP